MTSTSILKGFDMNEEITTVTVEPTATKSVVPAIIWGAITVGATILNLVATWKTKHAVLEYLDSTLTKAVPIIVEAPAVD